MPICQESFALVVLRFRSHAPFQPWTHQGKTASIWCHVTKGCRLSVKVGHTIVRRGCHQGYAYICPIS